MINKKFELASPFKPTGDQPRAIAQLNEGIRAGYPHQVLLGVTGSGKTFTMANIIQEMQRPTLVMAHNKTLAAQLFAEFREFFPNNCVQYFVSYYDYYQPEAYIPMSDTYIEKDSNINEEIEKFRHASTHGILTRSDTIIVASVSCIYGLGSPEIYKQANILMKVGEQMPRTQLTRRLSDIQYDRNDIDTGKRGTFRVQGDTVIIFPAYEDYQIRIEQFGDEIERITLIDPISGHTMEQVSEIEIFPARHYLAPEEDQGSILAQMERDMREEVAQFEKEGKLLEAQRLKQRVTFDLEMIRETGTTSGIENYSRYFDRRMPGTPPSVLLDYFPDDYLLMIDESHMTIPQVGGMYNGDKARKQTLIDYGFRLRAALDNRPLKFEEFTERAGQTIYVSATPGKYEMEQVRVEAQDLRLSTGKPVNLIAEQLIRPTGITDPEIVIRPIEGQIDDLLKEITKRVELGQRVLVTTLTKRMSEDITEFLADRFVKVQYLHSDVKTIERSQILQDLRLGAYDVLVGINLLREGIDLPEVSLVAILDADKEGFLRSETSLVQTIGRAARHLQGTVIMYADRITGSMERAIGETNRRRAAQIAYNTEHGITPQSLNKPIIVTLPSSAEEERKGEAAMYHRLSAREKILYLEEMKQKMQQAALNLDFEAASALRDQMKELQEK
jgi:excinuclease ABC subunit B